MKPTLSADQFITEEVARTGKDRFTYTEVIELVEKWQAVKQQAAAAKEWKSDETIDALLFGNQGVER